MYVLPLIESNVLQNKSLNWNFLRFTRGIVRVESHSRENVERSYFRLGTGGT